MARPVLTGPARRDILEIRAYLMAQSPDAARLVRRALQDEIRRLGSRPGIGHERPDLADPPVRFWTVYSYLIAYLPTRPVQILRALHAARDVRSVLDA